MSGQREATLKAHFSSSVKELRPLLVSLNGDNSWLISIPRPLADRKSSGKAYFHIAYDPWLVGPTSQWSTWLVHIALPWAPDIRDGSSVERVVEEIEQAAAAAGRITRPERKTSPLVDAIFLGTQLSDHTHRETLETFDSSIPVFGSKDAADTVRSWNYFSQLTAINDLEPGNGNWHDLHPGAPLPQWLSFFRLVGHAFLNFATSIVWTSESGKHESLLLAPHVIKSDTPALQTYAHELTPPIQVLAMFCPLKDSFAWGFTTVLGAPGALAVARQIKPKYWIKTADAELIYSGLVMLGVKDVRRTLDAALEDEKKSLNGDKSSESLGRPNFFEVDNGKCFVLA